MSRTMSYYDLRDALAEPGCPVCSLKARAAERYLDSLLWEKVNDTRVRDEIRRARGLCQEHTWGLVRHGAALGVSIITRDVLQSLLREMEGFESRDLPALSFRRVQDSLKPRQTATAELVDRLAPQTLCPTCVLAAETEEVLLNTLSEHLLGPDGLLAAYEASAGLCLPHFRQALTVVREEAAFQALMSAQTTIWKRLARELGEFVRKSDHRFRGEERGEEVDAWRRAIAALVGPRPGSGGP